MMRRNLMDSSLHGALTASTCIASIIKRRFMAVTFLVCLFVTENWRNYSGSPLTQIHTEQCQEKTTKITTVIISINGSHYCCYYYYYFLDIIEIVQSVKRRLHADERQKCLSLLRCIGWLWSAPSLLWWSYFSNPADAFREHRLQTVHSNTDSVKKTRNVFTR
jgi:hypothetical protein